MPFILFCYLTFIIRLTTKVGFITNYATIIYSSYIGGKLFIAYLKKRKDLDKQKMVNYHLIIKKEKKKIYFIYFIIYWLISYILNL